MKNKNHQPPTMRARILFFSPLIKAMLALMLAASPAVAQTPTLQPMAIAPVELNDATLIALPKLAESQVRELIGDVMTQYRLTAGYRQVDLKDMNVAAPAGVTIIGAMSRGMGMSRETVVLGFILPPRRLPQLWVSAWNGDLSARAPWPPLSQGAMGEFGRAVQSLLAERNRVLSRLSLNELESRVVSLSYVDADAALFALRAMGYAAITDSDALAVDDSYKGNETFSTDAALNAPAAGAAAAAAAAAVAGQNAQNINASLQGLPPEEMKRLLPKFPAFRNLPTNINFDRLPLIVRMPATEPRNMGLVGAVDGASAAGRDQLGLSIVPQAGSQLNETVTGGVSQLLVLYHPSYPEQFKNLRRIVSETIDRPARQVFVEGLVLEISSEALRELGVKWDLQKGSQTFSAGAITAAGVGDSTFSFARSALNVTPTQMLANIRALVQNNKAEVLSRPSVLTLDNRQATIRVGSDIPIATSKDASDGKSGRVSFAFQYLPTGILLNVRPRISEDGSEISMQIDATVSATVPNQDLRVIDPTTKVTLASAPTISTRRVQTYARIRDNTPLIIGGLVSRDQISSNDKIPLAGDIPFLGRLFGRESTQDKKREVIIVLTPSVVTENIRETRAQSPRDDDVFDLRDTSLFKEHYRIRAEDLVDSSYIRFNRRFLSYRDIANRAIERDPTQAGRAPFAQFAGTRIPGEFIFVTGMMYKMLDRLDANKPIKLENLMTFERLGETDRQQISLVDLMARYGNGKSYKSFFDANRGKALALTYQLTRNSTRAEDMFSEPVAKISLVDCANRDEWQKRLWEMNQPVAGIPQFTILIHDESDLRRVQLAIATQNTVLNNGGTAGMVFDRWLPGRMLHLQEVSPTWERVLLAPTAQYFFIGEHYMKYFMSEHERAMQSLDGALKQPENKALVEGITLP
jgi:general secretion pathway protein D